MRWLIPLLSLFPLMSASAAETFFIADFLDAQKQWPDFAEKATAIHLQGRPEQIARTRLKLYKSDLVLRSLDNAKLPVVPREVQTIEVRGRLVKAGESFEFLVDDLRVMPTDLETLKTRQQGLPDNKPEPWYELYQWAKRRGTFYEDRELLDQMTELARRGLAAARKALGQETYAGLKAIAEQVPQLGLPESFRAELIHEAWQLRWIAEQEKSTQPLPELADEFQKEMPGAVTVLKPPQPKLAEKYLQSPVAVYNQSDTAEREKLHRIFYAEILLASIKQKASADGSNGLTVADAIDKVIPEHHGIAEKYRDQALDYRVQNIARLTQQEVVELSELFRQRNEAERARKALTSWIESRVDLLKQEGPDGLMQAAALYRNLLEDEQQEAELLKAAWKLNPDLEEVTVRLTTLGYKLGDGQWLAPEKAALKPEDPIKQAMLEGRVLPGMTPEQVRKSQGKPLQTVRIVSAGQVEELWIYGERGNSRIVIHFQRGHSGATEVARISESR